MTNIPQCLKLFFSQLLALALAVAVTLTRADRADAADQSPKLRVLIFSGLNNHDWRSTTPVIKKTLEDCPRFGTVDVTDDPVGGDPAKLAGYDVIVNNWTPYPDTRRTWPAKMETAFLDFVAEGGGFVVFHASSCSFQVWPEFQQLVGMTWKANHTAHGDYHTFQVAVEDREHPIAQGLAAFYTTDELYHNMVQMTDQPPHVVFKAFSAKDKGGTGKFEPVLVCTHLGQGRGVNLVLGHDAAAMGVGFKTLLLRSAEWAATGKVTIPPPENWPTTASGSAAVDMDAALHAAARYRYGDDRQPLAAVEQLVRHAGSLGQNDPGGFRRGMADRMAALLTSPHTTPAAKAFFCRQLAEIGREENAAAVATLLSDGELAPVAICTLTRIPGPAADRILRDALGTLKGNLLIGAVNALGQRCDRAATAPLIAMLAGADQSLACAAANALGRIGTDEALAALRKALASAKGRLKAAVADACSSCADYSWKQADGVLALLNHGQVVWQWNYAANVTKPYFHPLGLSDGTVLTASSPPDHPWHHGFWFSWDMLNGVNYWEEDRATGKAQGMSEVLAAKVAPHADGSARIEMQLSYHPPKGPPVLKESRLIEVSAADEKGVYRIDWRGTFTAGEKDVLLKGGMWGGGYGGLAVRISQASADWVLVNSEGRRDVLADSKTGNLNGVAPNTHGKHAHWADFSLVASGASQPGGITIIDHFSNPRHPTQWHNVMVAKARFGYFNPALLWSEPYRLSAGQQFTLRYRIIVHPGRADSELIEKQWQDFASQ